MKSGPHEVSTPRVRHLDAALRDEGDLVVLPIIITEVLQARLKT